MERGNNPIKEQMRGELHAQRAAGRNLNEVVPDLSQADIDKQIEEKENQVRELEEKIAKAEAAKAEPENVSVASDKQPYTYKSGDEQMAFSRDWQKTPENTPEPEAVSIKSKDDSPEAISRDKAQEKLDQTINDFWAKQAQIAEMRAKKTSRFASLAKTLGIKTKDLDNDPEVMILKKDGDALYRSLISKGIHLYKDDKSQLENFLKQFDEFEVFRKTQNLEMEKRAEVAGFPENILAGLHKIGKRWSEMNKWQKLGIGAAGGLAIAGGGILLGAGTFGAAALGAGWRWGFRGFGAVSAGIGRKVMLDKKMMEEIDKTSEARLTEKMKFLQDYENNLDAGIAAVVNSGKISDARKSYEEKSLENTKKAVNLATWSFTISSVVGESLRASGISFGSVLKKVGGYVGLGGGTSGGAAFEGKYGLAGYGTETEGHVNEFDQKYGSGKYGTEGEGHINEFDQKYGPERYGTEGDNHVNEFDEKYGPEKYGTESEGHEVVEAHTEGKYGPVGHGTEGEGHVPEELQKPSSATVPEVEKPSFKELGYHKVGQGGGIERSAQAIIKANPKEFGLDPADPRFKVKVGQEAHKLARGLADRHGISYKELNEIASHKVQPGDEIRVYSDPETGKLRLTYNSTAFDEALAPKVSQVAPAEEIVSNRPASPVGGKLAVEDMKPKASAAEHRSVRSGTKVAGMEEIEADYKKDLADRSYARAVRSEQDWQVKRERMAGLDERVGYEAGLRQGMATRGLLKNVIHDAGIGTNVSLWDDSAEKWYGEFKSMGKLVSQDVLHNDSVVDINKKREILKAIFFAIAQTQAG